MTMTDAGSRPYRLRGGESWRDPWDDYRWLRDNDPVHRAVDPDHGEFVVLSRFEHVFDAVRDTATFSSARGLTLDPDVMDLFDDRAAPIVMMDPPDHTAMRRLVSKPMTPSRVSTFEAGITEFVDACLDRVAEAGDAEVDIVELFFKPLPSFLVAHYLGVPREDRSRFDAWTNAIVAANASGDVTSATSALTELFAYAGELIARLRSEPGDDLVSQLAAGGAVDDQWIVGFVFTMVTGGNDTTTGLLGGSLELLHEAPDQRAVLVDEPAAARPAVDELLRLTTPVQNLARTATRDVEVAGETIAEGQKVMLLYGSANRDEREFGADAGTLDVLRRPDRIVTFAYGAHHCLGAALARLAGGVALERLFARFPDGAVDPAAGRYAPGPFVRRYESLPFTAHAAR
jgi:cytochrome P450